MIVRSVLLRPVKVWMLIAAFAGSAVMVLGASALLYASLDHEFGPRIALSNPHITYSDSCQSGGTFTARLDASLYNSGDRPGFARVVLKQDGTVVSSTDYYVKESDQIAVTHSFALECGSSPRLTAEVSPL